MSRESLSAAMERVMDAKKDLADAEAAHADALARLRDEVPYGEVLVSVYIRGDGFGHCVVTKDEGGNVAFRRISEFPEEKTEAKP